MDVEHAIAKSLTYTSSTIAKKTLRRRLDCIFATDHTYASMMPTQSARPETTLLTRTVINHIRDLSQRGRFFQKHGDKRHLHHHTRCASLSRMSTLCLDVWDCPSMRHCHVGLLKDVWGGRCYGRSITSTSTNLLSLDLDLA